MTAIYGLAVTPMDAVLGERITASLTCTAHDDSPQTYTFGHASLVLSLKVVGSAAEDILSIPNMRAIETNGMLVRVKLPGGVEDLKAGEERSRDFSLFDIFPQVLDVGQFELSYWLEDSPDAPPEPVRFRVVSKPAAVSALLTLLDDDHLGTRFRAAKLLHRLTGRGFGYDPEAEQPVRYRAVLRWRKWWESAGPKLVWNSQADGVTVSREPQPAASETGNHLGGLVYRTLAPPNSIQARVKECLAEWRKSGTFGSLSGSERVADQMVSYPPEPDVLDWDAEVDRELAAAVEQLETHASDGSDHISDAIVILSTILPRPSRVLFPALIRLSDTIDSQAAWKDVGPFVGALLDAMNPARVPVAAGGPGA